MLNPERMDLMKKLRKLFGVISIILALVVMQLPASEADAATSASDFSITDNVLVKYNGSAKSVVIPDGVTTIATDAFKDNYTMTSVTIPKSVTEIRPFAFWNASALESVSLGSGLKEIGDYAFANCKMLGQVIVPANVKRIGIYAFEDCVNMTDITIPPETMEIHYSAFDGCYKLVIHAQEGTYAFNYAKEFAERQKTFREYEDLPWLIPGGDDEKDDKPVSILDEKEDAPSEGFVSPTVRPDGTIDGSTVNVTGMPWYDPDELASVHVVGNQAFFFVDGTGFTVYHGTAPGNVDASGQDGSTDGTGSGTGISDIVFENIRPGALPKFTIVDNRIVADQAYYCSTNINYMTLPDTIKEIGEFAFARSSLSSILLPDGLERIDYGAFYHCDKLSFVTIPDSVVAIEPKAFENTAWMDEFLSGEPSGDESDFLISGGVLVAYRGNAAEVTIPDNVRVIAAEAFKGHTEIKKVILPINLKYINEEAFYGCSSLSEVNLETTLVKHIADRAFAGTAIEKVMAPVTLEKMGINAFDDLTLIGYFGDVPETVYETSARRLSNGNLRENAYGSIPVGDPGVIVYGPVGSEAFLEGATQGYTLTITQMRESEEIATAKNRSAGMLKNRSFINPTYYDLELTDSSGISITKLGKSGLTVAIPVDDYMIGSVVSLTVLTTDRNGQLEEIIPELVNVDGKYFVRFTTYHLSPFAIYSTGNPAGNSDILEEEAAIRAYAMPNGANDSRDVSFGGLLKNWFVAKKFRLIPAAVLVVAGFVLIFYKGRRKGLNYA